MQSRVALRLLLGALGCYASDDTVRTRSPHHWLLAARAYTPGKRGNSASTQQDTG